MYRIEQKYERLTYFSTDEKYKKNIISKYYVNNISL